MSKRANGEGTVYQRKDGRWVASIILENGKRKSVYCKTQQEALKLARKANNDKDQGMLISTEDQTLSTFLTTWLQDTAQPRLRDRTYLRYRELIELHVLPMLGKVKLQKLSPQHLQKLYNQKREEGYAPQTIKHIHRVLHRALNDALKWDLVAKNICNAVDAPRVPKQEMKALTPEQAQQFLEAAKAGVPKIRFHDLRHSAASLLLSMGTHPKIVQELLGHSNISMTLDTYSHTIPSLQADAMSRLNTLLTQQETIENPVAVTVAVKADQQPRTKKKNPGLA